MIYLGADHGGYERKEQLKRYLKRQRVRFMDLGPDRLNTDDDYPLIALRVARAVRTNKRHRGILLCRSGVGVSIVANKVPGIRSVLANTPWTARMARRDEDANILSLSAEQLTAAQARRIVRTWLTARFAGFPRYRRRLKQIGEVERV